MSRFRAIARFRHCERVSSQVTVNTPSCALFPSLARRRVRVRSGKATDPEISRLRVTRVDDRLACWPPGPPDGSNDHSSSDSGTTNPPTWRPLASAIL